MPAPAVALAEPSRAQVFPPTTNLQAAVPLYGGLGTAKANRANPAGGGNAEGNWWTPSYVLETDCEGNKVRDPSQLTPECIAKEEGCRNQEQAGYHGAERAVQGRAAATDRKATGRRGGQEGRSSGRDQGQAGQVCTEALVY